MPRPLQKRIKCLLLAGLLWTPAFVIGQPTQIAFLSDIHFHDLYGSFRDHDYRGIVNPGTGTPVMLRTMGAQLRSTRLFNENYFALIAALDDVVVRGIKLVALPGDFSDDGQAYNLRGLRKLLTKYAEDHGIQFFITTGNHDPVGPFRQDAGKHDFLNADGKPIGIYSAPHLARQANAIITQDMAFSGYLEILEELGTFGLQPTVKHLYWSTPFDRTLPEAYTYRTATQHAAYASRMYEVTPRFSVPDLSYVVEPVEGVWLVAIDGNTYIPKDAEGQPADASNYHGSSIGYNQVLTHKKHLLEWVALLTAEAKKRRKAVIAFTHYPLVDYSDNASEEIGNLLGPTKWQLHRIPQEEVARSFAEAGLQLHFGGHMHINDTGIRRYGKGKLLVNVQVPSLAAYIPAYKILTVKNPERFQVETVVLDHVPRYNELFPLYEIEHNALQADPKRWNREILNTKSYRDFTLFHLQELVRLRMIPSDWPESFVARSQSLSGADLYAMSLPGKKAKPRGYQQWGFHDLLLDLYKFQSADELARRDIPTTRLRHYQVLTKHYARLETEDEYLLQLKGLFRILAKISNGEPSDRFDVDLRKGKIRKR